MIPRCIRNGLERILSLLLQQQVKILTVLPNEGVKIADEGSLLIMDIVVRLADGSIANVECQKNGYAFPGQRAACYSADLLMRQYRRERRRARRPAESFPTAISKVWYTIIFYEKKPVRIQEFFRLLHPPQRPGLRQRHPAGAFCRNLFLSTLTSTLKSIKIAI